MGAAAESSLAGARIAVELLQETISGPLTHVRSAGRLFNQPPSTLAASAIVSPYAIECARSVTQLRPRLA
jgi:hypothetical protein